VPEQAYGFGKVVPRPYAQVLEQTRAALKEEGFGIITEIDVEATMREKLGIESGPYTILGACNPRQANRVLSADPEMGLFLPCNVIVYATGGGTRVSAVDAKAMMTMSGVTGLEEVADTVDAALRRAVDRL
jgi:uncharacterized protein (DUF302 family)